MAYTHIEPGNKIEVSCYSYYSQTSLDISELTALSLIELGELEQTSVDKEQEIFAKIQELEKQWMEQARQTTRMRRAKQYLRTPQVSHTSNKWEKNQYGLHELSNMVYKLTWREYEQTRYDRKLNKSVTVAWELSWELHFNTPQHPDNTGNGRQIAGQQRKRFSDKASMEKYLDGRIKAHSHLFKEISPPIPKGHEGRFSINGVLLPGYTVEAPERTPQETADDLLAFLDDEDMDAAPPPEEPAAPVPAPPSPAQAHPHTPKKAPRHSQKKSAPTR